MNKPVYLMKMLNCVIEIDSFNIQIKIKDYSEGIKDNVEKRFDTRNYEVEIPCLISRRIWGEQGQS